MSWNDLSIREKADIIRDYVRNGITSITDIRNDYNSFAEGGSMEANKPSVAQPEEQKKLTPPDWALRYMKKDGGEIEPMAYPEVLPEVEVRPTQKDYDYLRWAKKIIPDAQSYRYDSPKRRRVQLFNGINEYYNPEYDTNPNDAIDRFVTAFELGNNPTIVDNNLHGKIWQKFRGSKNQVDHYISGLNEMGIYPLEATLSMKPGAEREYWRTASLMHGIEAELPHAIQYANDSIPVGEKSFFNKYIPSREHLEYETPGHIEYNAHEVIQPILTDYLKGEMPWATKESLIKYLQDYLEYETSQKPPSKNYTNLLP